MSDFSWHICFQWHCYYQKWVETISLSVLAAFQFGYVWHITRFSQSFFECHPGRCQQALTTTVIEARNSCSFAGIVMVIFGTQGILLGWLQRAVFTLQFVLLHTCQDSVIADDYRVPSGGLSSAMKHCLAASTHSQLLLISLVSRLYGVTGLFDLHNIMMSF